MNNFVSIIIPVYNVEIYLTECLDSIVNQTYKKIEIILVDDGSTDSSGKICDEYAKNDSRIKVIHKENGGQSSARNMGLDIATGDFIMFVDSDDVVDLKIVEYLERIIKDNDVAICDRYKFVNKIKNDLEQENIYYYKGTDILNILFKRPVFIAAWGKLYKKNIFKQFRFKEGIIFEDEDALPQIIYNCDNIVFSTKKLYFYRIRENSTMSSAFSIKNLDVIGVCERRIEFFKNKGLRKIYKKSVKDYWFVLNKLSKQTLANGFLKENELVKQKLTEWENYKVRFSFIEFFKYRLWKY